MISPSVRAKLDEHILAAQATLYRNISGGSFEIMRNWGRGYSGMSTPTLNVFLPLNSSALTDDTLADTAAFFASRKTHYAIEMVHDRLPEGPDFLNRRRYQPLPPEPAMALEHIPDMLNLNPDVTVRQVATVPDLTAFCALINAVFDFSLQEVARRFPVPQLKDSRIKHWLAFLDERPVGAGTTVLVGNVDSVWNVCTVDSYRRQGVATTLLHQMLTDTRENGSTASMLYSAAQAYNFFSRFGFEIFTQRQWFLPPGIEFEDDGDEL